MPTSGKPRRWLRFTLRGMLVAVAVFSIWLAWLANSARQQKQTVARLRPMGGIAWDYDIPAPLVPAWNEAYTVAERGPEWLASFFDIDLVANVSGVWFEPPGPVGGEVMPVLSGLPYLEEISFAGTQIEPNLISSLRQLPKLRRLRLERMTVTDQMIEEISQLRMLEELRVRGVAISGNNLLALSNLRGLEWLDFTDTRLSWGDIWQLEQRLPECQITPSTGDHLYDLVVLELDDFEVEAASGLPTAERTDWPDWVKRFPLHVTRIDADGVLALESRCGCKTVSGGTIRAWRKAFDGMVHVSHVDIDERGSQMVSLSDFTDSRCTICEIDPAAFD